MNPEPAYYPDSAHAVRTVNVALVITRWRKLAEKLPPATREEQAP